MIFFRYLTISIFLLQISCITVEMKKTTSETIEKPSVKQNSNQANSSKQALSGSELKKIIDRGNQYARDGLYREAVQQYKIILHQEPMQPEANRNIGMVYVKTGQYKQAARHLSIAAKTFSKNFETNYYLAESLRALNNFSDAIFRYKLALASQPNHVQTLKALAWSYFQIRYYKAAYETARTLKTVVANDTQVDIITARILDKMAKPKAAIRTIRKALVNAKKSEEPYLKSALGEIIANAGNCHVAIKIFQEALKVQPLLAGALVGLGKCLVEEENRIELARSYLERAIRLKPRLLDAYYYLGKSYEKTDLNKAKQYYARFYREAAGDPAFMQKIEQSKNRIEIMSKRLNRSRETSDDASSPWTEPM